MGKPTENELTAALNEAKRMREQGDDPHFVAKALLSLNYRQGYLLEVLHAAENYLHSGMAEHEHTLLLKAVEKVRELDDRGDHREAPMLGL